MASTAAMIKAQDEADAPVWARIKHDVDPISFIHECGLHPEHPGHYFYSYCVICPEDTGNGKISDAAREARIARVTAEREARWAAAGYTEPPF